MKEIEKMLSGFEYNSRDPELLELYSSCKKKLHTLNTALADETDRRDLLASFFGSLGEGAWIESPFYCDYGKFIRIGAHCFIHTQAVLLDSNTITLGDQVLIGPGVHIYTAYHPLASKDRLRPGGAAYVTQSKPVQIGDRSWIGGGVRIMPGVNIGKDCTIGAGSIVTKDIPDGVLALGNPCKVVRSIE